MIHLRRSRFFSFLLSFSLLIAPLPLAAMADEYFENLYVYLGSDESDIAEVIAEINSLDNDPSSLLYEFNEQIQNGFDFAEYNAVIDALEYAELTLLKKYPQLHPTRAQKIGADLDRIIDRVINGELVVTEANMKNLQDAHRQVSLPSYLQELASDEMINFSLTRDLVILVAAVVVSTTDIGSNPPSGASTIDGYAVVTGDRILLNGQSVPKNNGLWLANTAGLWTRPADFATGNMPDQDYVFVTSGTVNAGSSWLCITPTATIDTDPISFVLFASSSNTASTIVTRDSSGNFSAGTITAALSGNATTATTATNFSGSLVGDVTGTQGATVVSSVGGQSASSITTAITTVNAATSANTASTLVERDATNRFSAGAVSLTDGIISNSLTVTPFGGAGVVHNNTSGLLSSSLIVNADISSSAAITDSKLATLITAGKVNNSATTANSSNLINSIVLRDGSGNFGAGTITASLNGNATSATSATTATTSTNFTGSLSGDVTGTQSATVVGLVGSQSATNVANATVIVQAATSANTANTIVKRDASNRFAAGLISVTDAVISNSLTVTPFTTAGILHNTVTTGAITSSLIVNADISSSAAIANSKLATLTTAGLVANSATTATALNTANAIVARDGTGNVSATTFIGSVNGAASLNLLKAGDTMTGALQLPAGTTAAPALVFTGSTTAGLSASSGNLSFSTNALARMKISSGGTVSIPAFTSPGILHNDGSGNISSSLIVDSNIAAGAGIIDTKLNTISTAGKINNSATTATDADVANAIVSRDTLGNFSANVITADADVAVSGNLILSTDPSSSTAGNIFKGTNTPFIHNFGTSNVFVGENAGNFTMTGSGQNSVFGAYAFGSNSSGDNNTAIGFSTLPAFTMGTNNIAIGSNAGGTLSTGSGNIYINANASSSSESNIIRIGTSQTQCFVAGIRGVTTGHANAIAVLVDSAGQLGTISSSRKFKNNIQDMAADSEKIYNLRPVTFAYNIDETNTKQYGLIAEEVDVEFPAIVAHDDDGTPYSVQYHILPVLLLNEMKKQKRTINRQQMEIDQQALSIETLNITVEAMNEAIANLRAQVQEFAACIKAVK